MQYFCVTIPPAVRPTLLRQMDMGSLTCAQTWVRAVHTKGVGAEGGQTQTSLHKSWLGGIEKNCPTPCPTRGSNAPLPVARISDFRPLFVRTRHILCGLINFSATSRAGWWHHYNYVVAHFVCFSKGTRVWSHFVTLISLTSCATFAIKTGTEIPGGRKGEEGAYI